MPAPVINKLCYYFSVSYLIFTWLYCILDILITEQEQLIGVGIQGLH